MQQPTPEARSSVLVLDPKVLRRAKMAGFLRDWAEAHQVSIVATGPGEMRALLGADARFALGLLNLGAASLAVPAHFAWLEDLVNALPATPAAVLSDLENAEEVVAALRAGARGFLPTSTEPEVALNALSFLMKGGTFFPPAALLGKLRGKGQRIAPIGLDLPNGTAAQLCLPPYRGREPRSSSG